MKFGDSVHVCTEKGMCLLNIAEIFVWWIFICSQKSQMLLSASSGSSEGVERLSCVRMMIWLTVYNHLYNKEVRESRIMSLLWHQFLTTVKNKEKLKIDINTKISALNSHIAILVLVSVCFMCLNSLVTICRHWSQSSQCTCNECQIWWMVDGLVHIMYIHSKQFGNGLQEQFYGNMHVKCTYHQGIWKYVSLAFPHDEHFSKMPLWGNSSTKLQLNICWHCQVRIEVWYIKGQV